MVGRRPIVWGYNLSRSAMSEGGGGGGVGGESRGGGGLEQGR